MDTRQFCASLSVRIDTRRVRFELSPAPLHGLPEPSPEPVLPRGSRVSVTFIEEDIPRQLAAWTMTPPICACDGQWYVGASIYGQGVVMVPVNSLHIHGGRHGKNHLVSHG